MLAGRISGARIDGKDCTHSRLEGYDWPVNAPRSAMVDGFFAYYFFNQLRLGTRFARKYIPGSSKKSVDDPSSIPKRQPAVVSSDTWTPP